MKDKTPLIRDAADWARDWGWISHRRAKTLAAKLHDVADGIDGALNADEDPGAEYWCKEIRQIAKTLQKEPPAARRNRLRTTRFDKSAT